MCSRSWDHFIGTSLRELAEGGPGAPNRSPRDLARRAAEENAADPGSRGQRPGLTGSGLRAGIIGQHQVCFAQEEVMAFPDRIERTVSLTRAPREVWAGAHHGRGAERVVRRTSGASTCDQAAPAALTFSRRA